MAPAPSGLTAEGAGPYGPDGFGNEIARRIPFCFLRVSVARSKTVKAPEQQRAMLGGCDQDRSALAR
jgi:hypothetical protein